MNELTHPRHSLKAERSDYERGDSTGSNLGVILLFFAGLVLVSWLSIGHDDTLSREHATRVAEVSKAASLERAQEFITIFVPFLDERVSQRPEADDVAALIDMTEGVPDYQWDGTAVTVVGDAELYSVEVDSDVNGYSTCLLFTSDDREITEC